MAETETERNEGAPREQGGTGETGGAGTRPRPKRVGNAIQTLAHDITYGEIDDRTASELVREHWQKFVGAIALVMLAIWTYESVKVSKIKSSGEVSERFSSVQSMFDSRRSARNGEPASDFPSSNEKESAETASSESRALSDSIKALASGEGLYSETAELYSAALALDRGDFGEAQKILATYSPRELEAQAVQPLSQARIARELAALLYARAQLQQNAPDARQAFIQLARVGSLTAGEAALSLLRMSDTTAERSEAIEIIGSLLQRRPEMREALKSELELHGIEAE